MEAIVEYNYVAREPDELTIKKGDIIKEIKIMFGGWWEGTLRDKRGMFPDNFVKLLNTPTGAAEAAANGATTSEGNTSTRNEEVTLRNGSGRKWCKVVFSYDPCNDDELKLVPQDFIEFLGEVEEGWWRGRLRGQIGVFPSNFVSPPIYEEPDKQLKEREKRSGKITPVYEECRVLFPYKAANEDELTLVEGDIIKILSKDAPDKGWWKGELRGQIGLFPDNFVEVIGTKNDHQDQDSWHESVQTTTNSLTKYSHQMKKNEKAHVRKSLDVKSLHTTDTTKKITSTSSSSLSSTSPLASSVGPIAEKKAGGHSILSSIKCLSGDGESNNDNCSGNATLGEELDGVERGEGAPLSHLTASRAKAPRRRPPTSQHLRHYAVGPTPSPILPTGATGMQLESNMSNGNAESTLDQLRENSEVENLATKARKMVPWVEELKLNQLERRKIAADRVDKGEVKKEKTYARIAAFTNVPITPEPESPLIKSHPDTPTKLDVDVEDGVPKDKETNQRMDMSNVEDIPPGPSETPAFVPYTLYSQLLKRVAALEEQQAILQRTVGQLSEQLIPLLGNSSVNSKV